MIQPDLCLVGGLTEGKKIVIMPISMNITSGTCLRESGFYSGRTPTEAVIPNFQIHEHHSISIKNDNRERVYSGIPAGLTVNLLFLTDRDWE
jgi:L-alanine-DL-glutamate epimerase-like enolase superfamily enzyme